MRLFLQIIGEIGGILSFIVAIFVGICGVVCGYVQLNCRRNSVVCADLPIPLCDIPKRKTMIERAKDGVFIILIIPFAIVALIFQFILWVAGKL